MSSYTVKKGDTLSAIAKQYGTTYQEIAKANGISDPNKIYAGQTLNIGGNESPTSQNTAATTAPAQTESKAPTFNHTKSDAVAQAEAMVQQKLANTPGAFSFAMQAGWDDVMNKILNREKFSYDLNGDALYQQYKDQYTTQGKLAMMDTMGQAAAMTGGYGNSYAQSVGQQAYQGHLQQLNDKVPELYQLALDQYNQEGQDLYNQYGLYADKYKQEYGEHRDKVSDYYTDLNYLTENARYMSETEYNQALQDFNIKYGAYRDSVADSQWNQSFTYQQDRDKVADEQWQKTFDEGVRQFDADHSLQTYKAGVEVDKDTGAYYTANPGWDTETIKAFQKAHNLEEDGIWGPKTAAAYDKDPDWTYAGKGWFDYNEEAHNSNVKENGGSYYQQVLNDLKEMKKAGKTNADVGAFLQEAVGNSYISRNEYMTLYNKYRDGKL